MENELSVIITAYNADDLTLAHLRHSMDVSRVPDEIIVVNDGGRKILKKKIQDMERKCPVIYARVNEDIMWNYHGACNLAVWLSSGKYLAFEDNDNVPSRTFYEEALDYLKKNPSIGRVQSTKRKTISHNDFLNKSRDEWEIIGREGANMGTAIIPRIVFQKMKGHDERFCGRYGWMYYDWRSRGIRMLGKENYSASVGEYFYTKGGQSKLTRGMSYVNRGFYCENANEKRTQHPLGILNFMYEFETLARNTE